MKLSKRNTLLIIFDMLCFWFITVLYSLVSSILSGQGGNGFALRAFGSETLILFCIIFLARLLVFRTYNNIWRYTSTEAYFRLALSDITSGVVTVVALSIAYGTENAWAHSLFASLNCIVAMVSRFAYRMIYKYITHKKGQFSERKEIIIIGAGQLGAFLANELKNNPNSKYAPICFADTDTAKVNGTIAGISVVSTKSIKSVFEKHDIYAVVIAIANISSEKLEELYNFYGKFGCKVLLYETPIENVEHSDNKRVIRDFSIEDLLFRKQLNILNEETVNYYKNKTVLITGGGGSIGSEICRQVAKCHPKRLVILDIYENNAYDIQQELNREYGDKLDLCVEIGSVRDVKRLDYIFEAYLPQIVFHAAAHKHVPLMEQSCAEAIKNNTIGTYNTANMAEKYGVEKFILISTDKAVNPTNIMGASKRLCEMVVQCRTDSKTSFAAVRFGNVLGSNGSVVPLFKRQIENGGPVTLTDKRVIRYFMTIPEASQLVMTAGAMAKKGQLFVLDMGKPVKIYDLAVNMIRMYGYKLDSDIKIKEVGLRPGEKLYEELLIKNEKLEQTVNSRIFVERDKPLTREEMDENIKILKRAVISYEEEQIKNAIKDTVKKMVTTFKEPIEVNENAQTGEKMKKLCGVD